MPSITLSNVSKPKNSTEQNETSPLSFIDWRSRNTGISFSEEEKQYSNYVKSFYSKTETDNAEKSNRLKNDYINLIERLQIIFEDDVEFERYKNIDVTSETDLALAIPAYANKLKEIAIFYARKRQELKNKKIEYNLVGSYNGLSKLLYSNLVSKFTKNEQTRFVNENPLISQSPEFSAIYKDFEIEIEELYDTTDYAQISDKINPFACAFNDLCYSIFTTPLSAKADPLENNYLCNPSNDTVEGLLQEAYNKYVSTSTQTVSGGYYVENYKTFDIPFEQGNNFFYWFSGSNVFDIPEGIYKDLEINSFSWTNAIGGSAIELSDMMFVNVGNSLTQGAWLQDTKTVTVKDSMSATITDGKIFKFPYPNYGVSAVGGAWSGPGLDDTIAKSRKFFPTEEDFTSTENSINRLYWTAFSSISTVESVYLQETSLGNNGYASKRYYNADKLNVSLDNGETLLYSGPMQTAWLYDFRQTQIPITTGENQIYFPLQRYEDSSELFFTYEEGASIALSSIDVPTAFSGAVAGETLGESDLIIKNQTVCGPEVEAAWLKSVPMRFLSNNLNSKCACGPTTYYTDWQYVSGGIQPSVSFKCESGKYVRFVWTGNSVNINTIAGFTGFQHDDSCAYKTLNHSQSLVSTNALNSNNNDIFEKWKKCSCQAIQYSPFGHNETDLEHYNITPDFIVRDDSYPTVFNKKTWIGNDGNDYKSSKYSAKFFPNIIENDIGWGNGVWKTPTSESFMLEHGKSYIYHRSSVNNCNIDSPFFVVNEGYAPGTILDDTCKAVSHSPTWMKAVQAEDGTWEDAGVVSDMVLNFGNFLTYTHRDSYTEIRNRFLYSGTEVTSVSGEYVIFEEPDSNISYKSYSNTIPSVNFLMKIPVNSYKNFWGKTNYGDDVDSTKTSQIESYDFRIAYDYLQITQPLPSDIVLNDKNIVEYKFGNCNNSCFVWGEELSFTVLHPVKKWNAINFNNCVGSEILNYLNKEITNCYLQQTKCVSDCKSLEHCGCEHFCNSTKTGLTASYTDSDIVFNTELSGIPMFINYYARQSFLQEVTVQDVTDGEKSKLIPLEMKELVEPSYPWRNLLNQDGANFIVEENINNLKTSTEINFYKPSRVGMSRYETYDSRSTLTSNATGTNIYRTDNYFDSPFEKYVSDSQYITEFSLGKTQGTPKTARKQTFQPYTNANEKTEKEYYGLYELPLTFSPWNSNTGEWNESDDYRNYRNLYNVKCSNDWYSSQLSLTADVWKWQTDIYGNQYFTTRSESLTNTLSPSSFGNIFVKMQNGKVYTMANALSSVVNSYNNITAPLYDNFYYL